MTRMRRTAPSLLVRFQLRKGNDRKIEDRKIIFRSTMPVRHTRAERRYSWLLVFVFYVIQTFQICAPRKEKLDADS